MSLLDLYDLSLLGRGAAAALDVDEPDGSRRALTFGELEHRSNRLAHVLRARGLQRGDRLAFCLANRLAVVDLWLAAVKIGAIVVPVNVLYRDREIAHILGDAEPRAVVTSRERAAEFAATDVWDVERLDREMRDAPATRPAARLGAHAAAALVYTSGTTGAAKGAVLTHGNFAANALALVAAWRIDRHDRYLAALPLFHVHGLGNGVQCWLASGCHMRLVSRFDHARAVEWFAEYRPTLFFGVPTMYVRLLDVRPEQAAAIGRDVRLFVSGSAPLPAHVLAAFHERYGHVILERYGMSETLMNVSNPLVGERRPGSVGLPLPMTTVRIVSADGQEVADGESGELWVRGPHVCDGYWNRPDATAAAFADGWFRTGDLGTRSPDGYITLQGRRSDLIISGGFNIYPREIEEVLTTLPGVREAAVVGATDPVRGEVPVAYVVADAGFDPVAVEATLRTQVASFKVPRGLVRVDSLPRTALGKVQKHLLPPWTA